MDELIPPKSSSDELIPKNGNSPRNGWHGLPHWKQDLTAGSIVALVSMPLSLAISVASGAPPVAGLITAIISGFVLPCIGGSYVTISSPAAGMAPVLYQAIYTLGRGNLLVGYPLVLPLIILTGLLQLVLSRLRISAITNLIPSTVISGVLTSIGLIILVKQLPLLLGKTFKSHTVFNILIELPSQIKQLNTLVFSLGLFTLLLIILFHFLTKHFQSLQILPPFSYALLLGTLLGVVLPLSSEYLLKLPQNPLDSIVLPNIQVLFATPDLWRDAALAFTSIFIVATVESMATIRAIDNLDPFERSSDPEKSLLGIGACNMASGLSGGLIVIPEAMRSTVSILAGARTQWANFWNALVLLISWLIFQPVLTRIPLTVLAAILIASSFSLCKPANWVKAWQSGKRGFTIFIFTIAITLFIDLFWGLISGITLSIVLKYLQQFIQKNSVGIKNN